MALWSIWSAPLLMSNDLRSIKREHREILQNRHVIEVDQDELGIMGRRVFNASSTEIWSKAMTPVIQVGSAEAHSFAVVYFNRRTLGAPVYVSASHSQSHAARKDPVTSSTLGCDSASSTNQSHTRPCNLCRYDTTRVATLISFCMTLTLYFTFALPFFLDVANALGYHY